MIPYADISLNQRTARAGSAVRTFSSIVLWTFLTIPIFALVGGIFALLLAPQTAFFVIAAACVIAIVAGNAARIARRRRARAILAYVAQAVQMNLPISTILAAAAESESPSVARRINRLRTAIEDGSPIGDAVEFAVPQVPQRIVDLANSAERDGRLPQVLARLLDDHYPAGHEPRSLGFYGSYALILLLCVSTLITLQGIFLMPRFWQILKDFRTPVPAITLNVMSMGEDFAPVVCLIVLLITLIVEGRALRQLLTGGRPRHNPISDVLDHLIWYIPVWGTMIRNRGLADVCTTIAGSIDSGRPIEQAIGQAVQPHLNAVLRSQINTWAELTAGGLSLAESATRAKLPALIPGLAGTAVRAGNLPTALRFLARHYESSFSRTAVLIQAAAVPAVVLCLGAAVLCIALALFEPLIALIEKTASYTRYW